jgi:hypothetical protein
MVTPKRNMLTRGRTKIAVAVAITTMVVAIGGTAFGVLTFANGGPITKVLVRTGSSATVTSSTSYVDLPSALRTLTVPAGQKALVTARFTAESNCTGTAGNWCTVRIMANAVQMNPASGTDFAFDTATGAGNDEGWEGNAMERDIVLSAGTYSIKVQYAVIATPATFRLDDWHLTVESSKI